jgi:membrane protease YdiL (CAAX protease family)
MLKTPLIEHLSPAGKFFMLILLIIFGLFTFLTIGLMAATPFLGPNVMEIMSRNPDNMLENVGFLKYFQIISQIGFFIVPVLLFSFLIEGKPAGYLRLNVRPDWIGLLIGIGLIVLSTPLINILVEWNKMMRLPESLAGLENWMKSTEAGSEELTKAFLDTASFNGFLVNLLMIAILPAVGEEFLFRGTLTRIFFEWSGNKHVAVIVSALVFSALHMQFYGFLPRFVLGLLLGYLFVMSGNLWLSIAAHFINNGFVVIAAYLFHTGVVATDLNEYEGTDSWWMVALSFVVTVGLFWFFYFRTKKVVSH